MDNTRNYLILQCDICGCAYNQQERVFKKAKWKYRCEEHRKKYNYCKDCGIEIHRTSVRCEKCYGKSKQYEKKYCKDCGKQIRYHSTRCLKCHNIKQNKGKSTERTKFNNSKEWDDVRLACFERDNYTCQICGDRNRNGRKNKTLILNAHHIKSWKSHPDLRLILDNLITYCESCHFEWHNKNGRK